MIKNIYASAWILAAAAALISVLAGTFDAAAMVIFSLIAVVLFYAFALWSVIVKKRDSQPPSLSR